jgi:starch synthase (maltosyl-transferring)
MARHRDRVGSARYEPELEVVVDRVKARCAAWYELFPRSAGATPGQSGTFDDVIARLPYIQSLGFDVLYFPPIHPIGRINRKGPNNTLHAGPNDPGVPYAIGNENGGHDAIEPSLGTVEDFARLVKAAAEHGLEIALDFAIQAAPDHPWAKEHPEWFFVRPDGTIKFAENPPKRYEDIYPVNFNSDDWQGLWDELKRILLIWIERGVKIFRVDNPHTKPTPFWEWLIAEIQRDHPDVIFLAEAFTRPKVMKSLAKAGFTQSYSYFTWRNYKEEIIEYFTELTQTEVRDYMRANLFPNTPDILPIVLQTGGRPAFQMRLILAATLSSVYGMYSGFELCEASFVPGKEEYLNSEKYDFKVWDWDRPGNIIADVARINRIRRDHPALHEYDNLRFYPCDDPNMLCYGKSTADGADNIVVVVNLDPHAPHETMFHLPIQDFGIGPDEPYEVDELITGDAFTWTGGSHHLYLDPTWNPALIYSIKRPNSPIPEDASS